MRLVCNSLLFFSYFIAFSSYCIAFFSYCTGSRMRIILSYCSRPVQAGLRAGSVFVNRHWSVQAGSVFSCHWYICWFMLLCNSLLFLATSLFYPVCERLPRALACARTRLRMGAHAFDIDDIIINILNFGIYRHSLNMETCTHICQEIDLQNFRPKHLFRLCVGPHGFPHPWVCVGPP